MRYWTKGKKFLCFHWYAVPMALQCEQWKSRPGPTWESWQRRIKKVAPFQFWLRDTFYDWLHFWFYFYPLHRWYDFKAWLFPRNKLKIKTLSNHGSDHQGMLTHAMFAILDDFMVQDPTKHIDYTESEYWRKWWKDINEVHAWWQKRKDREKEMDAAFDRANAKNPKYYSGKYDEANAIEKRHEEEETEMLRRLVELRGGLWL